MFISLWYPKFLIVIAVAVSEIIVVVEGFAVVVQ